MMNIHESFPRYTEYDPLVPVWCLTHNIPRCTHRFFDSSAISPSGRYVAVFQLPFEDRQPLPGETGTVWLIDLETGEKQAVADTCGWEPQLGANINWGATDQELFFNDVDTKTWTPFAWKWNPATGEKLRMEGTVYHASSDGKWIVSSDLALLGKSQHGYGVVLPPNMVPNSEGLREDKGFYLTNTATGHRKLLVSIKELMSKTLPLANHDELQQHEIHGFHSKFNRQNDRIMLSLRWYPKRGADDRNMFESSFRDVRFAWYTVKTDGSDIHCALRPELFVQGGHHATWCPDGQRISLNLRLNGNKMSFASVKYDGSDLKLLVEGIQGSGHPTVHPCGQILTDTYLKKWDFPQYGDGTVPLRWVDTKNGNEHVPIRINSEPKSEDSALRVDPHPAWDRSWRYITFNGMRKGSRRVFLADMSRMVDGRSLPPPVRAKPMQLKFTSRVARTLKRRCSNLLSILTTHN